MRTDSYEMYFSYIHFCTLQIQNFMIFLKSVIFLSSNNNCFIYNVSHVFKYKMHNDRKRPNTQDNVKALRM